jgi:GH25 family lysozyme M1 (1,4-beta-N-acetylmuramidase)
VSSAEGEVDWTGAADDRMRFGYVKATEGDAHTNEYFAQQSGGAHDAGMPHGSYHLALPDAATGDDDRFNGTYAKLKALACDGRC